MTRTGPDQRTHPWRADIAARGLKDQVDALRLVQGTALSVTAPVLDLFTTAEKTAIGSQLLAGETFTVYDVDLAAGLAWGQCATDSYVGYAPLGGLGPAQSGALRIAAPMAPVFSGPDIKSPILRTLPFLAIVDPVEEDGAFRRIRTGGYIHSRHVSVAACDMVSYAEQFIGSPYLWGGRSYMGLDCSALVQLSALASGRDCPRDADLQEAALGRIIHPEDGLERGDLIFWRGHVGMMVDAHNLLHANAWHMATVVETFAPAAARIEANGGGPVTSCKRL